MLQDGGVPIPEGFNSGHVALGDMMLVALVALAVLGAQLNSKDLRETFQPKEFHGSVSAVKWTVLCLLWGNLWALCFLHLLSSGSKMRKLLQKPLKPPKKP